LLKAKDLVPWAAVSKLELLAGVPGVLQRVVP